MTQLHHPTCESMDYVDTNNNTYHITNDSIYFLPISAIESSTGEYSGGEPWSKKIDNDVRFEIENRLRTHISKKENILKSRTKPSIIIIFNYGKKTKKYIAKYDTELDDYFKSLKTNKTVWEE